MDTACEGSKKKEVLSVRTGPVIQIGAGKVKLKARSVSERDRQGEEGCNRTKKEGYKGVQMEGRRLKNGGGPMRRRGQLHPPSQ